MLDKFLHSRFGSNPKTTISGVAKIIGGFWALWMLRGHLTPEHFMNPESSVIVAAPFYAIVSGIESLYSADAKPSIPASEVKPDTPVVVDQAAK